MKKIFLALITAAVAFTFAACNEGTTVKWVTKHNYTADPAVDDYITDINWKAGGQVDQTWSEQLSGPNQETSALGVEKLVGTGDCIDSKGEAFVLTIDSSSKNIVSTSGNTTTLKENEAVELVISSSVVKK